MNNIVSPQILLTLIAGALLVSMPLLLGLLVGAFLDRLSFVDRNISSFSFLGALVGMLSMLYSTTFLELFFTRAFPTELQPQQIVLFSQEILLIASSVALFFSIIILFCELPICFFQRSIWRHVQLRFSSLRPLMIIVLLLTFFRVIIEFCADELYAIMKVL